MPTATEIYQAILGPQGALVALGIGWLVTYRLQADQIKELKLQNRILMKGFDRMADLIRKITPTRQRPR